MQTDEEVGKVAQAVPVIISRTLELFIKSLLTKTVRVTNARNAKTLSPSHLKQVIESESRFDFLKELVKNVPEISIAEEREEAEAEEAAAAAGLQQQQQPQQQHRVVVNNPPEVIDYSMASATNGRSTSRDLVQWYDFILPLFFNFFPLITICRLSSFFLHNSN